MKKRLISLLSFFIASISLAQASELNDLAHGICEDVELMSCIDLDTQRCIALLQPVATQCAKQPVDEQAACFDTHSNQALPLDDNTLQQC